MSDLLKLAERCEAATGPDRELDALIWCALNGKKYVSHHQAYSAYGSHNPETQVEFTEPPKRTRLVSTGKALPHAQPVTASIDAAMTLVPEGVSAIAILREAIDALVINGPPVNVDGLARFVCAAALRATAIGSQSV